MKVTWAVLVLALFFHGTLADLAWGGGGVWYVNGLICKHYHKENLHPALEFHARNNGFYYKPNYSKPRWLCSQYQLNPWRHSPATSRMLPQNNLAHANNNYLVSGDQERGIGIMFWSHCCFADSFWKCNGFLAICTFFMQFRLKRHAFYQLCQWYF